VDFDYLQMAIIVDLAGVLEAVLSMEAMEVERQLLIMILETRFGA